MTGMGSDGAAGLGEIKVAGGHTIAQDKESSAVYGMPRVATEKGWVDSVLPLTEMPAYLSSRIGRLPKLENRYVFV
jgi:two-component system chemotaxis response regulator CheB